MNPVVHFEMPYDNAARAAKFYESAFGWQMQVLGEEMGNYLLATTAVSDAKTGAPAGAINGGFFAKSPDYPAVPSVVIAVEDVNRSIKKVTDAGGSIMGEPMDIPGVGRYVAIVDTEGNRVGVLQPAPV